MITRQFIVDQIISNILNEVKITKGMGSYSRNNLRLAKKQYTEAAKTYRKINNIKKLSKHLEILLVAEVSKKSRRVAEASLFEIRIQKNLSVLRKKLRFYNTYLRDIYYDD